MQNGKPRGFPFARLVVSSRKRRRTARVFLGDAHRKSGVLRLTAALSPVESYSPPELSELTYPLLL